MASAKDFLKSEEGAVSIEYGLIAAGISIAIAFIVWAIGDKLLIMYTGVDSQITPAP
ncbi:MAG: Flp family type IVb pilin [Syntrophales bacterium]|jgi:Flp pilus assembly pilin Flp|nr:Flp family type IVb pilin [Syntrophales bacterium]MDY0044809.1 Flp family type IVb pilin [Syntrophales bacterium]